MAVLVYVKATWPDVEAGRLDPATATLGDWSRIADDAMERYGDLVLGIYRDEVVSAFDVTGWTRLTGADEGKVRFEGQPSKRWAHLLGTPNPGKPWVQGQARPVQYLDTAVLAGGSAPVEESGETRRRAVIDGLILDVPNDSESPATLVVPAGRRVTIVAASAA